MYFKNITFNRLSAVIPFIFVLLFTSTQSHAAENSSKSVLENIYQSQINSYYSINGFYNFSANQGAQKDLEDINASLTTMAELFNAIQGETDSGETSEQFEAVAAAWKAYQKVLKQNVREVEKTGYPDLRLAGDMATNNIALNAALSGLYDAIQAGASIKPSKTTQLSRDTATNLALMMTKYSARTTSTVSQVYAGGDVDKEVTIDSLAEEFGKQLQELMAMAEGKQTSFKLLDSANTKWDFIKNSYVNYNENRVNFIVNLYSKKIINDIEQALETM
ncbi:hypothetical protein A3740_07690 [Oleiphilus sp. HI0068]|nr:MULTISPECIES: hypothetical protein [unclassified Oleiphilus]KZY78397.1 hypothetical protein A3740_07690 [Oleiphilus sp. HI0068]KZY83879.1 hypothetical protein A3741_03485 [Oleiphilus sp. HI0069]KZY94327.1 hypothetical protein A3743_24580 [Oleiphilus sp. HI0072]KZZ72585.1 hypothetical protein A3763_10010 [Oleiphilus sp. HI0128]KZZ75210.1 hypothetical protein A3766_17335 [Oleiphilus sp. HI0132]